jgi:hypothetical protein
MVVLRRTLDDHFLFSKANTALSWPARGMNGDEARA